MNDFYIISEYEAGQRLDKIMPTIIKEYSRQQMQKWIKSGLITVNGQLCKPSYMCLEKDVVRWALPEEKEREIKPENIPLSVLYEDEAVLVINKPKGMLVHPTHQVTTHTLVNALKYHCKTLSTLSGEERPGIVHRLDQDTSGILIVAKDNEAHEGLKKQFQSHAIVRIYEAMVYGIIEHQRGIVQAPIGRNPKNRLQMDVVDDGKRAETHFTVLERLKHVTRVECELKTGRTHQIRVHMKYLGHPIIGDVLYSRKTTSLIKGQALFAKKLAFLHPCTGQEMTFQIEPPADFLTLLQHVSK